MSTKINVTPETDLKACVDQILALDWYLASVEIYGPKREAQVALHEDPQERLNAFGVSIILDINGTDYQYTNRYGNKEQARKQLAELVDFVANY